MGSFMKIMIKDTKFMISHVSVGIWIIVLAGSGYIGLFGFPRKDMLASCLLAGVACFNGQKGKWSQNMYRMLPMGEKEYKWMIVFENIGFDIFFALIPALWTIPVCIEKRDISIFLNCFICFMALLLWIERIMEMDSLQVMISNSGKKAQRVWEILLSFSYLIIFSIGFDQELKGIRDVLALGGVLVLVMVVQSVFRYRWSKYIIR